MPSAPRDQPSAFAAAGVVARPGAREADDGGDSIGSTNRARVGVIMPKRTARMRRFARMVSAHVSPRTFLRSPLVAGPRVCPANRNAGE